MNIDKKEYAEKMKRKRLARNLNFIRRSQGLSEQELAEKVGYKNGSHIVSIENETGDPSYEKIRDIANALDVSIPQLKGTGRKIEMTNEGWPKLTESERTALTLFAPVLDALDEEGRRQLFDNTLLVLKGNGVVPKWKKADYKNKEK